MLSAITYSVLCAVQVVGGLIRPHPGAKLRGIWSPIHHNLGRLAILLAWINIWLGVAIWLDGRDSIYSYNGLAAWVVPLAGKALGVCHSHTVCSD